MADPKKFIVFSHGRAGTNFLMNNLSAHPETQVYMEPFHNKSEARSEVLGHTWQTDTSSRDFAYENIFAKAQETTQAIGFKLFYFHCRQDGVSSDIWPALLEDRDVHVIFLNRKNLLNKHLSDLRAQISGVWHPRSNAYMTDQYKNVVDIHVKIPEAMRIISDLYCGYHRTAELFRDHPTRHYFYEDLETRSEEVFGDACDFLGVSRIPAHNPFRTGTLSKETARIVNDAALRTRLEASIFADFIRTCPLL